MQPDIPKMDSRYELLKGVQDINIPKMVVENNQMKVFKYENGDVDKADCFVVDLENISSGVDNEHTSISNTNSSNSRITLQRSLSRKIPQRGIEKKINDRDALAPSSSPRGTQAISTAEKTFSPHILQMGTHENSVNNHLPHHQITIKTGGTNTVPEGRWGRRSSFKRSPPSWLYDPKRILLFFATLSSMGTILLIYFTLSMSKRNDRDGVVLDWQ